MEGIDNKILNRIKKCGRGKEYFAADFSAYGEANSVRKALERLVKRQMLIRLARGIYFYPKIDKKYGWGILYPSWDEVAYAIAKRDKARIVPTGLYALNRLGLSTQVPMNFVYLTDGTPRRINTGKGKGILFKHTAPKNLAFQNELAMLITFALKEITQERVTQEHLNTIKLLLQQVPKEQIMNDAKLMPAWIKSLIIKLI
ncbi:hypothetical protein SAMD00024442_21_46 [Candidatus Symbiothrix dinenymphae]|nr:hypothetical protein SAMD00024442_21_46 [Candidatus Symbiothrix dinenymphae]